MIKKEVRDKLIEQPKECPYSQNGDCNFPDTCYACRSICWGCEHCEDGYADDQNGLIHCKYYEFPQKLRKTKCKGYEKYTDDWDGR